MTHLILVQCVLYMKQPPNTQKEVNIMIHLILVQCVLYMKQPPNTHHNQMVWRRGRTVLYKIWLILCYPTQT